ncbi:acyltransferase family protein [Blautia sp. MSJ-19]|uniref:acyltransferase family protein n=1 Tax=Blautia sp. MSJ-19 TaxID=2841517 RepID=UPI001C0EE0C8|nr:acyltransferase [Blautia sp. MSJ-19]MBU5481422.1 acyltransferase [Blautia sp. MSJ-19]
MQQNRQGERYYNIECLRFVFAVCIIYFHLLHSFIMPYTGGNAIYKILAEQTKYTKYIVECFFIISGYFLFQSVQRHPERSVREFICGRIQRLWPVLACSVCISASFFGKSWYTSFADLFFLQSSGLVTDWKGLNWYVSAFFLAEVFYFMLYKCFHNSTKMKLLICLLIYFGYVVNINAMNGGFGRKMLYGMLNLGLARAVSGVGLGYLIGMLYSSWVTTQTEGEPAGKVRLKNIGISLVEISTVFLLAEDFFYSKKAYENQFIVVILFTALFVCLLTRRGVFSKLTDHSVWAFFGRYTYSMYVMQEVAFAILKRTFWKDTSFIRANPAAAMILSIMIVITIAVLTYHLIERPGAAIMKKLMSLQ